MKKLFAFLMMIAIQSAAFGQVAANQFDPQIKRVAVFKNGYAFTYREAAATIQNGWAYTGKVPVGVLGTVWGYSTTPNIKVTQLLASETQKKEMERVASLAEFLVANEGGRLKVVLYNDDKGSRTFEGTFEVISQMHGFEPLSGDEVKRAAIDPNWLSYLTIALKTERGTLMIPFSQIQLAEIIGEAKWNKPKVSKAFQLGVKVEGAQNGQNINVGLAALEKGIRWIPAYRVEIKGSPVKEAKLELEAMLINDLSDMKDTDVYFVVGVPHFLFQDVTSPLSISTAYSGVSGNVDEYRRRDNGYRGMLENSVMSQVAKDKDGEDDPSPTTPEEEQTAGFSAEQLFLYQANQITLKKGERMSQRLFSLTVPCTEIFEWTINDSPQAANAYLNSSSYSNAPPQLIDLSSKIWYGLKMKNTTGMPWTTAPAMSFRDWKPLGQDLMTFTAIGGENILRVTPATEVLGTQTLEEKGRVREQLRYSGSTYDFDLVTIEGTIKLRNAQDKPVDVAITRNMVGQVLTASDMGKITKEGLNLQAINPNSRIKWNLTLAPGAKEIKYTYKVYVRA